VGRNATTVAAPKQRKAKKKKVQSAIPGKKSTSVFHFDPALEVARPLAGYSANRNLGNFNNAGVMVVVSAPCYSPEFTACLAQYAEVAKTKTVSIIDEIGEQRLAWPELPDSKSADDVDMDEMIPHGDPPPVGTVFVHRTIKGKASGGTSKIQVPSFQEPAAAVTVVLRRTVNLGDANSAKVISGGTLPCYREEIEAAIAWLTDKAKKHLAGEVAELTT